MVKVEELASSALDWPLTASGEGALPGLAWVGDDCDEFAPKNGAPQRGARASGLVSADPDGVAPEEQAFQSTISSALPV